MLLLLLFAAAASAVKKKAQVKGINKTLNSVDEVSSVADAQ